MNAAATAIAALFIAHTSWAQLDIATNRKEIKPMQIANENSKVAPALDKYAQGTLAEPWRRPELSQRDRSIVTLTALIAKNQTIEMARYMNLALDNGVKPREISEIITHLAFYSGWGNAAAAAIATDVFTARKIGPDQLAAASPQLLPLNKEAEEKRAASVKYCSFLMPVNQSPAEGRFTRRLRA